MHDCSRIAFYFSSSFIYLIKRIQGRFFLKYSIAGICVDGGRIFVAKRSQTGDMGNRWEFPGGKVDAGESFEEALKREFFEEFGIEIDVGEFVSSASFTHRGEQYEVDAFSVSFISKRFSINDEHCQFDWKTPEEILSLDFVDSDRAMFDGVFYWFKNKKILNPGPSKDYVPE